jgi:hypothetical protein
MESDVIAELISFETRVLLEMFLPETVLTSLIVILWCTIENGENYA